MTVDIDKTVHDAAGRAAGRATDFHNEIDRHRNLAERDTLGHFADQVFDAIKGFQWGIGMQCRDAAGMARVPELDHFEDRSVSDFPDYDAIRPQSQGCAG